MINEIPTLEESFEALRLFGFNFDAFDRIAADLFRKVDTNEDGVISLDELKATFLYVINASLVDVDQDILSNINRPTNEYLEQLCLQVFRACDSDGRETLTQDKFGRAAAILLVLERGLHMKIEQVMLDKEIFLPQSKSLLWTETDFIKFQHAEEGDPPNRYLSFDLSCFSYILEYSQTINPFLFQRTDRCILANCIAHDRRFRIVLPFVA
jgi:hypothetical protein